MSDTRKQRGYAAEKLVADAYEQDGYAIVARNFTIPGGELDLVATKGDDIIFIEVKLVDAMRDDLIDYVTKTKLSTLGRTIRLFMVQHEHLYADYDWRLDLAFVKDNSIVERYENIMI
jgi:putative endonuclease